jgi:DNA-binding CsgD family transcriptional regulator
VKAAALRDGGAAVDTEVLGRRRAHAAAYFRELAAPLGGQSTLYGLLRVRGTVRWAIGLGACGPVPFREPARRAFAALLPGLAVARASYAEPHAPIAAGPRLSPREREVLEYLCLGYTNAEIGAACGTSAFTVRNQLVSIYQKLGASTRAEAVALSRTA